MIKEIVNYGTNNLSCEMELVVVSADSLKEIIDSPEYHLNPSAPGIHDGEIYAVKGTSEQYAEFYKRQRESQIAKRVMDRIHGDFSSVSHEEYLKIEDEEEDNYQDWWKGEKYGL